VTATLSKLVLSARALEYEADTTPSDTPARLKGDAEELITVLRRFVTEAQRSSPQTDAPAKRMRAVFLPDGVGRGAFGGGSGGDWLGFGWAIARRDADVKILGPEVLTELSVLLSGLDDQLNTFASKLKSGQYIRTSACSI
jgi:son of sevenless-like protein